MNKLLPAIRRHFWTRHANGWSVWLFVGLYPLIILGLYRRDRRLLAGTLATVPISLALTPPPKNDAAWATKVVLGERAWLERGLLASPADLALMVGLAPIILCAIAAAAHRRRIETGLGVLASLLAMLLFFRRMVAVYEESL